MAAWSTLSRVRRAAPRYRDTTARSVDTSAPPRRSRRVGSKSRKGRPCDRSGTRAASVHGDRLPALARFQQMQQRPSSSAEAAARSVAGMSSAGPYAWRSALPSKTIQPRSIPVLPFLPHVASARQDRTRSRHPSRQVVKASHTGSPSVRPIQRGQGRLGRLPLPAQPRRHCPASLRLNHEGPTDDTRRLTASSHESHNCTVRFRRLNRLEDASV
jgi:hypothetical protein